MKADPIFIKPVSTATLLLLIVSTEHRLRLDGF
jgi:hypothetical protein